MDPNSMSSETKPKGRDRGKGRQRGRSRLGRLFAHGDLRFLILSLVAEKPRHGYELIKEIEDRVSGAYSPSPGVIYPTLTLLEELGWVTVSTSQGTRKVHEITEEGSLALKANRPTLDAILARMEAARAAQLSDTEASEDEISHSHSAIVHAREALRIALHRRLADASMSDGQVGAIAAALLTAAAAIENA